jgi:hypothetical protein
MEKTVADGRPASVPEPEAISNSPGTLGCDIMSDANPKENSYGDDLTSEAIAKDNAIAKENEEGDDELDNTNKPDTESSESDGNDSVDFDKLVENAEIVIDDSDISVVSAVGWGETITSLNQLLFEVGYTGISFDYFDDMKQHMGSIINTKEEKLARRDMGLLVENNSDIIGSMKEEPDRWLTVKWFSSYLRTEAKNHFVKMKKVDCCSLVTSRSGTFLVQAVVERKSRPPKSRKTIHGKLSKQDFEKHVPFVLCHKQEIKESFDQKYEVSIVVSCTPNPLVGNSFFTNNLRSKSGNLEPNPIGWLNLNSTTGT